MADTPLSKKRKTMASGADDYPPDVEVLMNRVVKQGLPCHICLLYTSPSPRD